MADSHNIPNRLHHVPRRVSLCRERFPLRDDGRRVGALTGQEWISIWSDCKLSGHFARIGRVLRLRSSAASPFSRRTLDTSQLHKHAERLPSDLPLSLDEDGFALATPKDRIEIERARYHDRIDDPCLMVIDETKRVDTHGTGRVVGVNTVPSSSFCETAGKV